MRNEHKIVVRIPREGINQRPRRRCEDNLKIKQINKV
jgi:hypothetical protein